MSNTGSDTKDAKLALCASWAKRVETACENDSWGQILDAAEEYENVIKSIANSVVSTTSGRSDASGIRPSSGSALKTTPTNSSDYSSGDGFLRWDSNETEFLKNVALCLKERVDVIQSPISKENRFPRENVTSIIGPLRNMSLKFPESVQDCIQQNEPRGGGSSKHTGANNNNNVLLRMKTGKFIEMDSSANGESWSAGARLGTGEGSSDEDESSMNGRGANDDDNQGMVAANPIISKQTIVAVALPGNLLPQLAKKPGETLLEVVILKVALKDARKVNDCFWVVSVKDGIGLDLTPIQSTPSEGIRRGNEIVFNTSVHIQLPLEKLSKSWAIFFELKFPKNEKVIVLKCWALLESDEVKSGAGPPQDVVCELYKKPTDFRRKKISLLTSKEFYLHLRLIKHS